MKLPDARVALGYGRQVVGIRVRVGRIVAHRALRRVRDALAFDCLLARLFLAMPVLHANRLRFSPRKNPAPQPSQSIGSGKRGGYCKPS